MARESGFAISNVRWAVPRTDVPNGSNESDPTVIEQVDVACDDCSHTWTARRRGPGQFIQLLVHIRLTCPSCGRDEVVALDYLRTL